uniref:Uncharacterized protein n=1 Tax=Rhizophora mucronata TaxID=61149 RepID=A0A2P2NZB5_RHIMU
MAGTTSSATLLVHHFEMFCWIKACGSSCNPKIQPLNRKPLLPAGTIHGWKK